MAAYISRSIIAAGSLLASAALAAPHAHDGQEMAATGGKPVVSPIIRTATTISGQPLKLPQGKAEMVAAAVDLPAGGRIMLHRHSWSRFVYVEKGRVEIVNRTNGAKVQTAPGQVFAEVVGQWHEAVALDGQPARLIVIDLVPPGVVNMQMPK